MKYLRQAIGFLTILPVHASVDFQPGGLGRAAAWYPMVGLLLGLLLCACRLLAAQIFPDPLGAVLVVAVWAALTGGLHLDGLADCCDGLLAALPPERRLEIMRDPRLGTFGGAGLILFLLLKVSAIMAVPLLALAWKPFLPLLIAPVAARGLILLAARQPMARPGGLGAEFALGVKWHTYIAAALLPLALAVLGGPRAGLALILALGAAYAAIRLARSRLGGLTGDVLGLMVEISELVILLVFAASRGVFFFG
jgi:adenosylcobinamide-GDP ribazoletransferase